MRGIKELGNCKVVRDIEDTRFNGRGHCGEREPLPRPTIAICFHQIPQTRPCVRNQSGSGYKSPRETTQFSPNPLTFSLPSTSNNQTLSKWFARFAFCMTCGHSSDRSSCYQQFSFVLVNKANCANCNCGDKCVAQCRVRCVGCVLTPHSTAAPAATATASALPVTASAKCTPWSIKFKIRCLLICTTTSENL